MANIEQRVIGPDSPREAQTFNTDFIQKELIQAGFGKELLPPQFIRGTFFKNGGDIRYHLSDGIQPDGIGFKIGSSTRWYPLSPTFDIENIRNRNPGENPYSVLDIHRQNHRGKRVFTIPGAGCDIVKPGSNNAPQVIAAEKKAMGYDDSSVYPYDLWLPGAGPITQFLVLDRQNGTCVGYLLGFEAHDKDGKKRIESQVIGVIPEMQNKKIAEALKRQQRLEALEQGYDLIRWTFDPLKSPNAHLNLNKLGGVIRKFLPNHYQFGESPDPDAIPASRFQVDWEIASEHVEQTLENPTQVPNLEKFTSYTNTFILDTLNCSDIIFDDAKTYLVEIPSNWELMLKTNPKGARIWREKSDRIFSKLLNGSHIIKSEVKSSDGKYYYVVEPSGES